MAAKALAANADRDARISKLRAQGKSLAAIGAAVGLTRQRVCAILQRLRAPRAA